MMFTFKMGARSLQRRFFHQGSEIPAWVSDYGRFCQFRFLTAMRPQSKWPNQALQPTAQTASFFGCLA